MGFGTKSLWLFAPLALVLVGGAGCSGGSDCSSDDGCAGGVCVSGQCVQCREATDCQQDGYAPGFGFVCQGNACRPECADTQDCQDGFQCLAAAHACAECLASFDCPNPKEQACKSGRCIATCDSCDEGEFCFDAASAGKVCITVPQACSPSAPCPAGFSCQDGFNNTHWCAQDCWPAVGGDIGPNAQCWDGFGYCRQSSNASRPGYCYPPLPTTQSAGEICQDLVRPDTEGFNACQAGLTCTTLTNPYICLKLCNNKGPNECPLAACLEDPRSSTGYACSIWQRIRNPLETCENPDMTATDGSFHHCRDGMTCEPRGDLKICIKSCNPHAPATGCTAPLACVESDTTPGTGICAQPRTATQPPQAPCRGDNPLDETWNDCALVDSCLQGVCGPARQATRTAGQTCELAVAGDPGYDGCLSSLDCRNGRCMERCGATCASGKVCYDDNWSDTVSALCVAPCDPWAATSPCGSDYFCQTTGRYGEGVCLPVAKPETGTGAAGQSCGQCNGAAGLFCSPATNKCEKACDPYESTGCGAGEVCRRAASSSKGGVCLKATTAVGQACKAEYDQCAAGLQCLASGSSFTCQTVCDPRLDLDPVAVCGAGARCAANAGSSFGGVCAKLPPIEFGRSVLGDQCTAQFACDGSSGLFCELGASNRCMTSCNPRVASTCASTEECVANSASPLGGACLLVGAVAAGDSCATDRCMPGLACTSYSTDGAKLCLTECDPTAAAPGCPATTTCAGIDPILPWIGACMPTRSAIRTAEQTCMRDIPSEPSYNGCTTGLYCHDMGAGGYCLRACDPFGPSTCTGGDTCLATGDGSPKGVCVPALAKTRDFDQVCRSGDFSQRDTTYADCKPEFTCATAGDQAYCRKPCTRYDCDSTEVCVEGAALDGGGACFPKRKSTQPIGAPCMGADPKDPTYNLCQPKTTCPTDPVDPECVPTTMACEPVIHICVTLAPPGAPCNDDLTRSVACTDVWFTPEGWGQPYNYMCLPEASANPPHRYCMLQCYVVPEGATGYPENMCPVGFDCLGVQDTMGYCAKTCETAADCSEYSGSCSADGHCD